MLVLIHGLFEPPDGFRVHVSRQLMKNLFMKIESSEIVVDRPVNAWYIEKDPVQELDFRASGARRIRISGGIYDRN